MLTDFPTLSTFLLQVSKTIVFFDIGLPNNSVLSKHGGIADYSSIRRAVCLTKELCQEGVMKLHKLCRVGGWLTLPRLL